ncbi:MAG: T9SS type A sorting domain-containing protein, partial [Prolixibacteraceae bacterium]|nr:T9SS type A sorting domain-containing protein [Prolixibacteraceae bacterium]
IASSILSVWPNPSKGIFNIKSRERNSTLKVLDLTGKLLYSDSFDTEYLLDLSSYKSTNYILKISTSGYTKSVLVSVRE